MTKVMPLLQKYDITFLRPPTIATGLFSMRTRMNLGDSL